MSGKLPTRRLGAEVSNFWNECAPFPARCGQENGASSNEGHGGTGRRQNLGGDRSLRFPSWCPGRPRQFMAWGRQRGFDCCFPQGVCWGSGRRSWGEDVARLVRTLGDSYCSFVPVSSLRALKPCWGLKNVLGENLGVFGWEEEIWGHSGGLHPSRGALWAEVQAYCTGLQRANPGLVAEEKSTSSLPGSERQAENPPDLRSNFRLSIFWRGP